MPAMSAERQRPRYVYKVLVNQMTREFRYVQASSIEEAERKGIVVLLVGPADQP